MKMGSSVDLNKINCEGEAIVNKKVRLTKK